MGDLNLGIWEIAPISPKSPRNSILSTFFERYDGIVTKEQLASEEFFKKLRKKIIPIEKANHPDRYYKNDYTGIDKKIKDFLRELTDQDSYFDFFKFSSLPEDDVIRLAELFVCRPDHLRDIYKHMKDLVHWNYDYRGLIYNNHIKIGEDIYADYKSVLYSYKALKESSLLDDDDKHILWSARSIFNAIIDSSEKFLLGFIQKNSDDHNYSRNDNILYDIKDFFAALDSIKRFINLFFYQIRVYDFENKHNYRKEFCQALTIELYMDLIETIVRVTLMYYVPIYVNFFSSKTSGQTKKDAYKRIIDRANTINKHTLIYLNSLVKSKEDGSTIISSDVIDSDENIVSFDIRVRRFVYFLERATKYKNLILTLNSLQMIQYNNQTLSENSSKRFERKRFTLSKLLKYQDTEGNRKYLYRNQMQQIKLLLDAAEKCNNNDLLFCHRKRIIYKELFVRKQKTPVLHKSTTKIMNDLVISDFSRKKYIQYYTSYSDDHSEYKVKRQYRQSLHYLDQAFIRGFFCENNMFDEYKDYVYIISTIHQSLLNVYLFYDYDLIFLILQHIAMTFVDALSFDTDSTEPEPILYICKEDKKGQKYFNAIHFSPQENDVHSKHPRGRKRKITPDDDKKIEELIVSNNKITIKEIIKELSLEVAEESVRQHIKKMGYKKKKKNGYSKKTDD